MYLFRIEIESKINDGFFFLFFFFRKIIAVFDVEKTPELLSLHHCKSSNKHLGV